MKLLTFFTVSSLSGGSFTSNFRHSPLLPHAHAILPAHDFSPRLVVGFWCSWHSVSDCVAAVSSTGLLLLQNPPATPTWRIRTLFAVKIYLCATAWNTAISASIIYSNITFNVQALNDPSRPQIFYVFQFIRLRATQFGICPKAILLRDGRQPAAGLTKQTDSQNVFQCCIFFVVLPTVDWNQLKLSYCWSRRLPIPYRRWNHFQYASMVQLTTPTFCEQCPSTGFCLLELFASWLSLLACPDPKPPFGSTYMLLSTTCINYSDLILQQSLGSVGVEFADLPQERTLGVFLYC